MESYFILKQSGKQSVPDRIQCFSQTDHESNTRKPNMFFNVKSGFRFYYRSIVLILICLTFSSELRLDEVSSNNCNTTKMSENYTNQTNGSCSYFPGNETTNTSNNINTVSTLYRLNFIVVTI